jgi:hypothetical protein
MGDQHIVFFVRNAAWTALPDGSPRGQGRAGFNDAI